MQPTDPEPLAKLPVVQLRNNNREISRPLKKEEEQAAHLVQIDLPLVCVYVPGAQLTQITFDALCENVPLKAAARE